jgi:hypothetical protein
MPMNLKGKFPKSLDFLAELSIAGGALQFQVLTPLKALLLLALPICYNAFRPPSLEADKG